MRGVVAVLAVGVTLAGCASGDAGNLVPVDQWTPPPPTVVTYDVTGSATSADITYATPSGTSQQQGVDVPLKMKGSGKRGLTFDTFGRAAFLYISAQNKDEYGDVTCTIKVDGEVVATNTASGGYAVATCEATL